MTVKGAVFASDFNPMAVSLQAAAEVLGDQVAQVDPDCGEVSCVLLCHPPAPIGQPHSADVPPLPLQQNTGQSCV